MDFKKRTAVNGRDHGLFLMGLLVFQRRAAELLFEAAGEIGLIAEANRITNFCNVAGFFR